jgi:hypothetical protein
VTVLELAVGFGEGLDVLLEMEEWRYGIMTGHGFRVHGRTVLSSMRFTYCNRGMVIKVAVNISAGARRK